MVHGLTLCIVVEARPLPLISSGPQGGGEAGATIRCRDGTRCQRAVASESIETTIYCLYRNLLAGLIDDGRSWLGFHDGISNIKRSGADRSSKRWTGPRWMQVEHGFPGCLAIDLAAWRSLSRQYQKSLWVGTRECGVRGAYQDHSRSLAGSSRQQAHPYPIPIRPMHQHLLIASHIHRANQPRLPAGDGRSNLPPGLRVS